MIHIIDTTVFIRYLTNDHPSDAQACYLLFQKAKHNQIEVSTTEAVIAEVVCVLSSPKAYCLPRERIRALLYPLLSLKGLKLPYGRRRYLTALDLYVTFPQLDFVDAFTVAHMRQKKKKIQVVSYNRAFNGIPGVKRVSP